MKNISLMGASGSIGLQTLDVIRENPSEFKLVAVSVGRNIEKLKDIIQEFAPALVSVQEEHDAVQLQREFGQKVKVYHGNEGLENVSTYSEAEIVLNAVIGSVGLSPTLKAIQAGKTIALANKETLVTAGHIVMNEAKTHGVSILPVDSEHSAIYQCLQGEKASQIERLIVTASGGSFRDNTRDDLKNVTVEQALNHPNWSMGAKITIDSATMMNKGLEVIEAHWLFDIPYDKIDVLLHRESVIHSMIEFQDSSVMAQLGTPDMRVPIQYALTYPDRMPLVHSRRLKLEEFGTLHFEKMDFKRFKCLDFAYHAGKMGGSVPTVLNAANEVAVAAFLQNKITFLTIEDLIEKALEKHSVVHAPSLGDIHEIDLDTRNYVKSLL
ncbi:1-deoxy-D-xylulose 5-phosphate reductoisomerase [Bacillus coahuilensis p1.1.43]|uniref:1-deoxy-D-xylulose 5-phosphate reductoisomerase n=1 Tax=Bacillus coahuilensis p1.1.43 TaxID=1150625 RepID=A0A147KA15_9BACI|nr:1-deoxy-D-xylulose-5-phosphate reductoisomerase [Bacillus coahuilensis]KUP07203.1 1-deoxy-D-xylulose 5-phosphate reductoisomerase [Bacillus coahuilensis p1.1.43]